MISTVGFGDIAPKTDAAMIVVSFQIMLDLVLLVGIVRAVFFAAQVGVRRRQTEREGYGRVHRFGISQPKFRLRRPALPATNTLRIPTAR